MTEQDKINLALRVMRVFDGFDGPGCDEVWWRTNDEYAPVTMLVNCNDLFFWASADCEPVTAENIDLLEQTVAEVMAIDKTKIHLAPLLWVARVREMRPQGAYYKYFPETLVPLFNAAGPERAIGLLNPTAAQGPSQ